MKSNPTTLAPQFRRARDFAVRAIAGETILVPIRSGVADLDSIFLLNEAGSVIWETIERDAGPEELIDAVVEQFDVPRETAARDVAEYLSEIERAGLIRRSAEGPP